MKNLLKISSCLAVLFFLAAATGYSQQTVIGHVTGGGAVFDVSTTMLEYEFEQEINDGTDINSVSLVNVSGTWYVSAAGTNGTETNRHSVQLAADGMGNLRISASNRITCFIIGCPIPTPWPCGDPTVCAGNCGAPVCQKNTVGLAAANKIGNFY